MGVRMSDLKKTLQAIEDYRSGKMIIVSDDKERENEGDFIIAAEKASPDDINFMMKIWEGPYLYANRECNRKKTSVTSYGIDKHLASQDKIYCQHRL